MKTHRDIQARLDALPANIFQVIKDGFVVEPRKELKATKVFFVNREYPDYAKNITYEKYTAEGEAAIVAEGSKNIPLINDYVTDITCKVVTVKQGLVISDLEQRALAAGESKFRASRVSEIRYQINLKLDKLAFAGDAKTKIPAITSYANAGSYTFEKAVTEMTGFELLEALRKLKSKSEENDVYSANILLVPKKYWPVFTTAISTYDTTTVMDKIRQEGLFELVEKIDYLDTLATDGKPYFVAIDGSRDNVEYALVQEPQQLSEHFDTADNLQINFGARSAGVLVYHELAITYGKQP